MIVPGRPSRSQAPATIFVEMGREAAGLALEKLAQEILTIPVWPSKETKTLDLADIRLMDTSYAPTIRADVLIHRKKDKVSSCFLLS